MSGYNGNVASTWTCTCGKANTGKFCVMCGAKRPNQETTARKKAALKVEEAARQISDTEAVQEAGVSKAAKEKAAHEAEEAASKEAEAQKAVARKETKVQAASVASAEANSNNGMLKKAAIGLAVLLVLVGAYFMFGRKKEAPPANEPTKIETKAETENPAEQINKKEKNMDPAVKAEKLKEYVEIMKVANAEKKQDATANEKIVFLVDDLKRNGNDLVVVGHFYNGKKNRTITSVKSIQLDIMLRDMDKELLNEKNIKYENAFTGMRIEPLQDSQPVSVDLPGKAPAAEFNNYVVTVHDVHWEAVGN